MIIILELLGLNQCERYVKHKYYRSDSWKRWLLISYLEREGEIVYSSGMVNTGDFGMLTPLVALWPQVPADNVGDSHQ